jgi:hypothetical protein
MIFFNLFLMLFAWLHAGYAVYRILLARVLAMVLIGDSK